MSEEVRPNSRDSEVPPEASGKGERLSFNDLASFSKAVKTAMGVVLDFESIITLTTNFLESTEEYLILNIVERDAVEHNNLLFLARDYAFLYSKKPLPPEVYKPFEEIIPRSYGRGTVLAFIILERVLDSYKQHLESLVNSHKALEQGFDSEKYRELTIEFERLEDRLEEFHDLLLRLEERSHKQVQTKYISFDYRVLMAESASTGGRCRRRFSMLRGLQRDHELQVTSELNKRLEKLNDVVKRLTALTVILMLPTLIAAHYGMNFTYMPELRMPWTYPAVIVSQLVLIITGIVIFRKIGWL
ncbi:MAG: magnesium transporter CorA family protein [Chloroflexi bacterium]|nr:magnesium transporter CorA family protein [Chloroflexota bacterium]